MKKILYTLSFLALAVLLAACSEKIGSQEEEMGYLKLNVETCNVTVTKAGPVDAPVGYAPKQIFVEVKNSVGNVVASTTDFDTDTKMNGAVLALKPGSYTIVAHSNGWDGSGSGVDAPYYYGETTATVQTKVSSTANVTLTQANVKVTVNFSSDFVQSFASATSTISSSLTGVTPISYTMGQTKGAAFFPVADLTAALSVTNKNGELHSLNKSITGVQARDHYIINYALASSGTIGGVTVVVDQDSRTYTYTFEVPRTSGTTLATTGANAWSTFAFLEGSITSKTSEFDQTGVTLEYKAQGATDWTTISNSALTFSGDNVSCKLTGLNPQTSYSYKLKYQSGQDVVYSAESDFTTESQMVLYNGGFENWHQSDGLWYAGESGRTYWGSSNVKAFGLAQNATTQDTSVKHSGSSSAKLSSSLVMNIKFAAGSVYTGQFLELVGISGAKIRWGVDFNSRPTALQGYMMYAPAKIDSKVAGKASSGLPSSAPAVGSDDVCQIHWALTTEKIEIDNTNMSTIPDWQTDSRIVAYGTLPDSECVNTGGSWKQFNIPLEYHNGTRKPSYLIIIASASRYGDYFYGGDGSVLHLDDFSLVYGDNPQIR